MDKCKPVNLISTHIIFTYLLQVQEVIQPFKGATEALLTDKCPTAFKTCCEQANAGEPEPDEDIDHHRCGEAV